VVFGTVAPLGILVTLLLTLTLAPALLAVLPFDHAPAHAKTDLVSIRLLTRAGAFATARAGRVLVGCAALAVLAGVGILRLELSFDSLAWFPDDLPVKVASRKLDAEFGGAVALEMLIETGEENGLHDPELLRRIDRAQLTVANLQVGEVIAGKSVSLIDVIKEIHQALNGGAASAHTIPGERALVSQELLLFENSGSDDLQNLADSQFSLARFTMRLPMLDGSQYPPFADEVERIFDAQLEARADASLTGMMIVMGRSFVASIETLIRSYGIALAVITPLMMLLLGSIRLGLIAMIPNLFPIVLTLGLMGWVGIPIEMFSLLIGSVALGLAVDDTIHFMHGFRRGYASTGDVADAVRSTLRTTGQALLFTSIVLSVGFFIYALSDLSNLRNFGTMTAFAIVMAFVADVLLAPVLLTASLERMTRGGDA
jgi:predicted RND superfamily exporter protein